MRYGNLCTRLTIWMYALMRSKLLITNVDIIMISETGRKSIMKSLNCFQKQPSYILLNDVNINVGLNHDGNCCSICLLFNQFVAHVYCSFLTHVFNLTSFFLTFKMVVFINFWNLSSFCDRIVIARFIVVLVCCSNVVVIVLFETYGWVSNRA